MATNRFKDVDDAMLRRVRVLIITRGTLALLYKQCWESIEEKGEPKRWVRKEGVPMHPFWLEKWDLLGIDEAYVAL